MNYTLTREYLKPKQQEIFDKVFRKEAQKDFINLCKKHLICPECGDVLFCSIDNKYSCGICDYIDSSNIYQIK
jgi:ribosomal protein S27AE